MRFELDILGEKQVSRDLMRFGERADDMTPALSELADDFLRIEKKQFRSQGGYASGGWAPLAPSTLLAKAQRGLDPRKLHATLALRRSLTSRGGDHVRRIYPDRMEVGTQVDYAIFHQHGTSRMPRRRPVELRGSDRRRWIKVLQRFLVYGEVGGGL